MEEVEEMDWRVFPMVLAYSREIIRRHGINRFYSSKWVSFQDAMVLRTVSVCHAVDLQDLLAVDVQLKKRLREMHPNVRLSVRRQGYLWGVYREAVYFRRQWAEAIRREEIMNLHEIEAKRRQKKRNFLTCEGKTLHLLEEG